MCGGAGPGKLKFLPQIAILGRAASASEAANLSHHAIVSLSQKLSWTAPDLTLTRQKYKRYGYIARVTLTLTHCARKCGGARTLINTLVLYLLLKWKFWRCGVPNLYVIGWASAEKKQVYGDCVLWSRAWFFHCCVTWFLFSVRCLASLMVLAVAQPKTGATCRNVDFMIVEIASWDPGWKNLLFVKYVRQGKRPTEAKEPLHGILRSLHCLCLWVRGITPRSYHRNLDYILLKLHRCQKNAQPNGLWTGFMWGLNVGMQSQILVGHKKAILITTYSIYVLFVFLGLFKKRTELLRPPCNC